jgi:hypothetical protein
MHPSRDKARNALMKLFELNSGDINANTIDPSLIKGVTLVSKLAEQMRLLSYGMLRNQQKRKIATPRIESEDPHGWLLPASG